MAKKQGQDFEWSVFYMAAKDLKSGVDKTTFVEASKNYRGTTADVRKAADNAVKLVNDEYGKITKVEKMSGGKEPKCDIMFIAGGKKIKCSLKYGGSVQLSSAGVSKTVEFLTMVIENYSEQTGKDKKLCEESLKILTKFSNEYGNLGKMKRSLADKRMANAKIYDAQIKKLLGSRTNIEAESEELKLAIIKEAVTGSYQFGRDADLTADHILSEHSLRKIDKKLLKTIADGTSARIRLKGRGREKTSGQRLNEIVVSLDANVKI
jgi:hypothetical protein